MNLNYSDSVLVNYNNLSDVPFLVDSQADFCVIKKSDVPNELSIDKSDVVELKGITQNKIKTLGKVNLTLRFPHFAILHDFHIVPNDFAIPTTGLIGKDFIKLYACMLDYGKMTFTIRTRMGEAQLSMDNASDSIYLPPRSEIFRVRYYVSRNCKITRN